tara:strand:- start:1105 stop:1557 length:453 start_codon:yes stop_codon:yes gene_type:complete
MNPEHKALAENIIARLKKSSGGSCSTQGLSTVVKNKTTLDSILDGLENDYGLIRKKGSIYFGLTKKGWKFKSFDQLEKDEKKTPFTLYQKIQLPAIILFGLSSMFLGYLSYDYKKKSDAKSDNIDSLSRENILLKKKIDSLLYNIQKQPK